MCCESIVGLHDVFIMFGPPVCALKKKSRHRMPALAGIPPHNVVHRFLREVGAGQKSTNPPGGIPIPKCA